MMLQGIPWSTYLEGATIITAFYYACIAFFFYRSEIRAFLISGNKRITKQQNKENPGMTDDTASFEALESFVHEIDSILERAGIQATKDQLLQQLKAKLASYGGLRQPAYRAAVFNHMIKQAEEICGVRISAGELDG